MRTGSDKSGGYCIINIRAPAATLSLVALIVMVLSGCASAPVNVENSRAIVEEKGRWYKDAKRSEERWGTPIHVQLAAIR